MEYGTQISNYFYVVLMFEELYETVHIGYSNHAGCIDFWAKLSLYPISIYPIYTVFWHEEAMLQPRSTKSSEQQLRFGDFQ